MRATMFHKSAVSVTAAGAAALGHSSPRGGGSPLHAAAGPAGAAGAPGGAGAAATNPNVEEDEVSEYTDADESISAPTEFLAEVSN